MALGMDESAKDTLLHPHPSDMGCLRICGHYRPNHTPGAKSGVGACVRPALFVAYPVLFVAAQALRLAPVDGWS